MGNLELSRAAAVDIIAACAGVVLVIMVAGWWCHNRLYSLIAKYGSSVLPDAGRDPDMRPFGSQYARSPFTRYINNRDFVRETRPDLQKAGERAYWARRATIWMLVPALALAIFLYAFYIRSW